MGFLPGEISATPGVGISSGVPIGPVDISIGGSTDGTDSITGQVGVYSGTASYNSITGTWSVVGGLATPGYAKWGGTAGAFTGFGYGSDGAIFVLNVNLSFPIKLPVGLGELSPSVSIDYVGNINDVVNPVLDELGGYLDSIGDDASNFKKTFEEWLDGQLNAPGSGSTGIGTPGDGTGFDNLWCCISIDEGGRWVAYESPDSNITPTDTNGKNDIFIYQLKPYVYSVGSIQRVSLNSQGQEGNDHSFNPHLSGDGNWVAYTSFATNLVSSDTNGVSDIFVSGIDIYPSLVSVSAEGMLGNGASYFAAISYDGSEVAFVSEATNLVSNDANGLADIFLRDRAAGTTELISAGLSSAQANGASTMPTISGDGDLVAFVSAASNLVAADTNAMRDIFVHDRAADTTTLLTKAIGGAAANGDSWAPVFTPDGRYVVFFSTASNIVAGDTNGKADVFLADRQNGTIERVSVGGGGAEANGDSGGKPVTGPFPGNAWGVAVSSDGRFVSFISEASNLVDGDTNGQGDVFLYDRSTGETVRVNKQNAVSQASGGPLGSFYAGAVAMSGDASVIAYISDATNLLATDTNSQPDVFVFQANERITPTLGTTSGERMVGTSSREFLAGLSGNDRLEGLAGDDMLFGGSGNDTLIGGEGADQLDGGDGDDLMIGGNGDDKYVVESIDDRTVETTYGGFDTVETELNGYKLATNLESLLLTGVIDIGGSGNAGANLLTGNSGANLLSGDAGDDIVVGGGGNDDLRGNAGNDRLVGETGDDKLDGGAGADILDGGDGIDNLAGGEGDDSLSGGVDVDTLFGGAGSDVLDGGAGADVISGGVGFDTYVVDDVGDQVIETSGFDVDTVEASISYTLTKYVENLVLKGAALNGTGNVLNNTLTGNDLGNKLDGGAGSDQLNGGKGDDIYVVDNPSDQVVENLNEGTDTVCNLIDYTLSENVEKLTFLGTGDISGIGNTLANTITGNDGDNRIDGGAGIDTMIGGKGDDTYIVSVATDVVTEALIEGFDRVEAQASYVLGANIEDLQLYVGGPDALARNGTGNALANTITGNEGVNIINGLAGDDVLIGNGGNDQLNGGDGDDLLDGGIGSDKLTGGLGNDTYVVNTTADVVTELANEGTDTVRSSVTYTLGAEVENLVLTDLSNANGTGNSLANRITGNEVNNTLDGKAGADILEGGNGDDIYVLDDAGDVVIEQANGGTDTVRSTVNHTLGVAVEHLALLGTAALAGIGNALDNRITGNSGANTLFGGAGSDVLDGGAGADVISGGVGFDTYVVDDVGDQVIETSGFDVDTVEASISYTLTKYVENLVLKGAALNGTGNVLNNTLTGNDLGNKLDGGAGSDQLNGGKGDDIYVVDNPSDQVVENLNEGTDTVCNLIDYTLSENVEKLTFLGTGDISGIGNTLANTITGNDGDNRIDGGAGIDTMIGGKGDDTYIVSVATDVVTEALIEGFDRVEAQASYVLGANIEDLQLYVGGPDALARNGTGNALANTITGNEGVNIINGLAGDDVLIGNGGNDQLNGGDGDDLLDGGIGSDKLTGGLGNDTYVVNTTADVVTELANEGTDTVRSSVTYTLGAEVENLVLTDLSNANGTGNSLANRITGNEVNNTLDGMAGADILEGGNGDDIYVLVDAGDVVIEQLNGGTDTVRSSVSHTLADEVENLVLLGSATIAEGNSLDNKISGNSLANTLSGGLGADILTGGAGADTFMYFSTSESEPSGLWGDSITDFSFLEGDRIDVQAIDAVLMTAADEAFAFIGSATFSNSGQIRSFLNGFLRTIEFNIDSGLEADMVIQVTASSSANSSWFIL